MSGTSSITDHQSVQPDLDIVIPVYNEGANIVRVLRALEEHVSTSFRVLICYDFDEDDTLPHLPALIDAGINIALVKNTRKGAHGAVVSGFEYSTAPMVLMFPADDDYNPPRLDSMVEAIRVGHDIVCPSRFIPGGKMVNCPWLKAFLVRCSAFVLKHLARLPTHDPSNGFRLFSRRVLDEIPIESSVGFTYGIELLVKAHRLRWPITEVAVHWYERGEGEGQSRFKVLNWLPAYLEWFFYAFATTYLFRGPETVKLKPKP
jgi:dolichol-phosphate mannosyltransferase